MAEIIRPDHRGRALGAIQSAWAVGWGAAVLLSAVILTYAAQDIGWRLLFAVGVLPALLILYIRRGIKDPPRPAQQSRQPLLATLSGIFKPEVLRSTLIGGLFGIGAHGGYAALTTFLPTYLREVRHLSVLGSSGYLAVIIVAFFCGCVTSGVLSDGIGRRANAALFAAACVTTVLIYIFVPLSDAAMLVLGFPARLFLRRDSRQHGGAFQRALSRRRTRHRGRLLLQFRPRRLGRVSVHGRLPVGSHRAWASDQNRRGLCLFARAAGRAAAAGNARQGVRAAGRSARKSLTPPMISIDTHAHVFHRGLALADERRYAPDYDAPLDQYLSELNTAGIGHGVLVQPSFLGTENWYLLNCIRIARGRLRGIAVVDPAIGREELQAMDRGGIVGIRLNLVGRPLPDLAAADWQRLLAAVVDLGWQVEVQRRAADLPDVVTRLLDHDLPVVIDHFALPDPCSGIEDPAFAAVLKLGTSGRVWVKLSAPYRNGRQGFSFARQAYPKLRDAFGLERLMWGSDWPHTRFEAAQDYASNRGFLDELIPDEAERARVLAAPKALFRF